MFKPASIAEPFVARPKVGFKNQTVRVRGDANLDFMLMSLDCVQ